MNIKQQTYLISFIVLLVCILLAVVIYMYTGNLIIAIFFAPPIIYWILQHRNESKHQ